MVEELIIKCSSGIGYDRLEFEFEEGADHTIVFVFCGEEQLLSIFVEKDDMRRLFNWLGVQLHKGGPGA